MLRFERDVAEALLDSIRRAGRTAREKSAEFARQIGREVNDPIIAKTLSDGENAPCGTHVYVVFGWPTP